ncbi:PilZ domain-containing protein [Pseudenhygromyxa sp. WMMC2535]|uniref:PilZ domain-containing protein n=1 Tax=Pseudenhygromyxa sp. WMMC2535 TaxID=2712867 RepID=UPI00155460A7|nr:PilZ domain-containing protein [Pseudenhygromyxa sp. WMMC2535]NVB38097.1 PilZ domain-containing protein [Pseudenhygromyxa sp. WMMC2535]
MSIDRRQVPRVSLHAVGTIDFGERTAPCQLLDLSRTGLRLVTPECDLPADPVRIRFQLGRTDAAWTEVDARLVRARDYDARSSQWGMAFLPMDPGTRLRLRDFLALRGVTRRGLANEPRWQTHPFDSSSALSGLYRSARSLG